MAFTNSAATRTPGKPSRNSPFARYLPTITPNQLWVFIFSLWFIFLSGLLTPFLGTPGILQALKLKDLLSAKQDQIDSHQGELQKLENDAEQLEKNRVVQQREIRKVLGYAAPDEIIFDFSSGESSL